MCTLLEWRDTVSRSLNVYKCSWSSVPFPGTPGISPGTVFRLKDGRHYLCDGVPDGWVPVRTAARSNSVGRAPTTHQHPGQAAGALGFLACIS